MAMHLRLIASLALVPPLAACGSAGTPPPVRSTALPPPPAQSRPEPRAPFRRNPPAAHLQMAPGLEGVIGKTGAELVRQFGPARLDGLEGDARKMQFASAACVLDIYLYPLAPGQEPQASYAEARNPDGAEVDRAACVASLRKR